MTDSVYDLCRKREISCRYPAQPRIFSARVYGKLYEKFNAGALIDPGGAAGHRESPYGSVFNLEFSPQGDFVVTVCANRAIVVYDPRYHSKVHAIPYAHQDCVNCVTFLSDTLFATCSDDCTIRLWDFRNLHSSVGVLRGHKNWVKNIEYDRASRYLFSIAFHDGLRYWDLDNLDAYSGEGEDPGNLVSTLSDPVRMRLSPDGSKMFVSSRLSRCLVISDFDGKRLSDKQDTYKSFVQNPRDIRTQQELLTLTSNKPSLHILYGQRRRQEHRVVMSAIFHPSSQFLGLRHVDMQGEELKQELTSLFALRSAYIPYLSVEDLQYQYLKYVDEDSPDESINFIKEICFSRDGRVLASPHRNGVRLLSVDSVCTAADAYYDDRYYSQQKASGCPDLDEVCFISGHSSPVLTCKFAHHDLILASGSLEGTVAFSKPQL